MAQSPARPTKKRRPAAQNLDFLDENVRQLVARAGCKPIRIASKSVRSPELLRYLLGSNPAIRGVMTFSAAETVSLSKQGFDDLLLAYPVATPADIAPLLDEIAAGKTIRLMVDSVEQAQIVQTVAAQKGVTVPLCLDLDMSTNLLGAHVGTLRSSVATPEQAVAVYDAIAQSPNLRLAGVMGYEAQIASVPDSGEGLKSLIVPLFKRISASQVADRRAEIVAALKARGAQLGFVNGGGTGSLETTRQEATVSEVTVGSGFYAPALFDHYDAFHHLPALAYAVPVTRKPKPGVYTLQGGGIIGSGDTSAAKQPVPFLPAGAALTDTEGAGEVQTPIEYTGPPLALGQPVFFRPAKAGEPLERFTDLLLVRTLDEVRVVGRAKTYRGRGDDFG